MDDYKLQFIRSSSEECFMTTYSLHLSSHKTVSLSSSMLHDRVACKNKGEFSGYTEKHGLYSTLVSSLLTT